MCIMLFMTADAERFRQEAEECRQWAEKAVNHLDKEAWLRLATEWLTLAQGADQSPPPRTPEGTG
jgi:hypothetical protein